MITDNITEAQVESINLRIAQEVGCSSDRVYLSDIQTKMGILNVLVKALGEGADAIEQNAQKLWKLKWRGLDKLKGFDTFRCSIRGIAANLKQNWPGANSAVASIKKSLRFLEDLGIFRMNPERETPIRTVEHPNTENERVTFKSPDKQFLDFDLELALEAFESLQQLYFQHSQDTQRGKRRHKTVEGEKGRGKTIAQTLPEHAGMLVRLIFGAIRGRRFRGFGKLPDSIADLGYNTRQSQDAAIAKAMIEVSELSRQIAEHSRYEGAAYKQRIAELEQLRNRAERAIAAIGREMTFAELPY